MGARDRRATLIDCDGSLPAVQDYINKGIRAAGAPKFDNFGSAASFLATHASSGEPAVRLGPLASWALELRGRGAELSRTLALAPGELTCSLGRSYPRGAAPATTAGTATALSAHFSSRKLDLRAALNGVDRLSSFGFPVRERHCTLSASTELERLCGLKV